ncbi:hypothetical protein SRHO_G00035870 [Serrasalmus rhombeus]
MHGRRWSYAVVWVGSLYKKRRVSVCPALKVKDSSLISDLILYPTYDNDPQSHLSRWTPAHSLWIGGHSASDPGEIH